MLKTTFFVHAQTSAHRPHQPPTLTPHTTITPSSPFPGIGSALGTTLRVVSMSVHTPHIHLLAVHGLPITWLIGTCQLWTAADLGAHSHNPQHPHQQPNDGLSTPAGVLTHYFLCFSGFHHPPSAHLAKNCHINFYHSTPPTTMLLRPIKWWSGYPSWCPYTLVRVLFIYPTIFGLPISTRSIITSNFHTWCH